MHTTIFISTIALAAVSNALPSHHKHGNGHSHARRGNYDLSGVDWNAIDWSQIFGGGASKNEAAATVDTPTVAPVVTAPQVVKDAESAAPKLAVSTSSTTSGAGTTSSGGKKGLAWDQGNDASLASLFETGKASWAYNWGLTSSFSSSLQFVPMIKSLADVGSASSVPAGSTVLGFNEPDQQGISASAAAAAYKSTLTPLRQSGHIAQLISPAPTNGGAGLPWLQEFVADCSDCELDALAVHWYGPNMAMFESQMAAIHAAFPSMKLWVTEIGCTNWNAATNPSAAEVAQFMTDATAWLEASSYVEKYSFFAAMPITDTGLGVANSMLTGASAGSSLTSLGAQYVD